MKKGKALTLLSLICLILVAVIVATFVRFSVGIKNYNSILGAVQLDYDLAGGVQYTYTLEKGNNADVDMVEKIINSRLEKLGYTHYSIDVVKVNDEGVEDSDFVITTLNSANLQSDLEAVFAHGSIEMKAGTKKDDATVVLENKTILENAEYMGNENGGYFIKVKFTEDAYNLITKDGKNYVEFSLGGEQLFANTIKNEEISNREYVFGYNSMAGESYAKRVALQLATGGLSEEYKVDKVEIVPAVLGEKSALISLIIVASLIVVAIVGSFVMFKGFGLISGLTLLTFILSVVGLLVAIPNIYVDLSAVIGIVISTIIAIDGLMLIFNRIKEEFANGKTVKAAVNMGFRRAFRPILNVHVVGLIVSLLILFVAGGRLKGFGITASIGIVVSFIATSLISKMFILLIMPIVKKIEVFFNFKRVEE